MGRRHQGVHVDAAVGLKSLSVVRSNSQRNVGSEGDSADDEARARRLDPLPFGGCLLRLRAGAWQRSVRRALDSWPDRLALVVRPTAGHLAL